jgi:uncharacterized protein involved in response to NO
MSLPIFPSAAAALPPPRGLPLLRLGFRPFYLGAAVVAALAVPWWLVLLLGGATLPTALPALLWHAHEMLYGFAAAVIVGFLLTAGKAWTGLPTPRGGALAALVLLWLAGRGAMLGLFGPPSLATAALDVLLLPVVAGVLARVLWRAGNRRNLPLVDLLLVLAAANATFHAAALGGLALDPMLPLQAALGAIVMIECVMAGRVVPAFTLGATPGLVLAVPRGLSAAALASTGVALVLWLLPLPAAGWPATLLLLVAALLQLALQWHWRPGVTRGRPILWILHAAYAWIPVGLVLLAVSALGGVSRSAGVHALAVGATGGLVIGMLTRTARGHTGRPLTVGRPEVLAYGLVMAAALLRVFGPMAMPPSWAWVASGAAWSAAFLLYLVVFTPWLTRARADGRDG